MKFDVVIIEDDPRYRSLLAHVILSAPDMALLGVADDLESGRTLMRSTRPDVVLIDLGLPSGSGIELIRLAADQLPAANVMVISMFGDEAHVLEAIESGATGYLLKDARNDELADQIRALHAGGSPVSPLIARKILARFAGAARSARMTPEGHDDIAADLSPQERKVLVMSAKGHTYDETARIMGVSRQTILTYVKRSYVKLQVHSKVEAVSKAQRAGLIPF